MFSHNSSCLALYQWLASVGRCLLHGSAQSRRWHQFHGAPHSVSLRRRPLYRLRRSRQAHVAGRNDPHGVQDRIRTEAGCRVANAASADEGQERWPLPRWCQHHLLRGTRCTRVIAQSHSLSLAFYPPSLPLFCICLFVSTYLSLVSLLVRVSDYIYLCVECCASSYR